MTIVDIGTPAIATRLADWLVEQGIGSISLNPDTVAATWRRLASH